MSVDATRWGKLYFDFEWIRDSLTFINWFVREHGDTCCEGYRLDKETSKCVSK